MSFDLTNKVEFSNWSYRDLVEVVQHFNRGELEKVNPHMAKVLVDYPTEESLDELGLEESVELKRQIMIEVNKFIESQDVGTVTVDFRKNKWNDKRMGEFREAQVRADVSKVEKLLREVAFMDDVNPKSSEPLTMAQGAVMARAVMEKYRKILSGK